MDTLIKPIETRYDGTLFRSRLEARWAVFFNRMGIRWTYEKEGYETPLGRYLPDFWLPEVTLRHHFVRGVLFEIKPENWSAYPHMHEQLEIVAKNLKVGGVLAVGFDYSGYHIFRWNDLCEIAPDNDSPMMIYRCPKCRHVKFDYASYDSYYCDECQYVPQDFAEVDSLVYESYLYAHQYRFW